MSKEKIAILGDGGWGTTLAILLSKKGCPVSLWGAFPDYLSYLDKKRVNPRFLPGIKIPKAIKINHNLNENVTQSNIIILAIPSQYIRNVLEKIPPEIIKGKIVVSAIKGIENNTFKRISEIVNEIWKTDNIAVLSGPTIAPEVAKGIPTTAVISTKNEALARRLQVIFTTDIFRIYTNNDIIGTELGGSLKNIIALACGMSDGLGFGSNTKAALLTRGIVEMIRLGIKLGAKDQTFMGISGLGDLVTTCFSPNSRNRYVGEQLGKGRKISEILSRMKMVAEGIPTTKSIYFLSKKLGVDMPITNQVYAIIYKNKNPLIAVKDLMTRKHKRE